VEEIKVADFCRDLVLTGEWQETGELDLDGHENLCVAVSYEPGGAGSELVAEPERAHNTGEWFDRSALVPGAPTPGATQIINVIAHEIRYKSRGLGGAELVMVPFSTDLGLRLRFRVKEVGTAGGKVTLTLCSRPGY
jgi:hypothetical protein